MHNIGVGIYDSEWSQQVTHLGKAGVVLTFDPSYIPVEEQKERRPEQMRSIRRGSSLSANFLFFNLTFLSWFLFLNGILPLLYLFIPWFDHFFGPSYRWGQNSQQRSIYGHFSFLRLRLSSSPASTSRMFQNQTAWNPIRDAHPHLSNSAADFDLLYSPEFCKILTRFSKIFIIEELEIVKIKKVGII